MNETILLDCGHLPVFFVADEKMSPFHSNLAFIRQAWRKNRYENQDVRTFIQIFSFFFDTSVVVVPGPNSGFPFLVV